MDARIPILPDGRPGEDFPTVGRTGLVLGRLLWLGIPATLIGAGMGFVLTGWPLLVLGVVLPLPLGMLVVLFLLRRHGANVIGWDNEIIRLRYAGGSEVVRCDSFEGFKKLWLTHKLEGGGRAWVAVLVKYRTGARSRRVLLTVAGASAEDSFAIFPGPYETVFDRRIPHKS